MVVLDRLDVVRHRPGKEVSEYPPLRGGLVRSRQEELQRYVQHKLVISSFMKIIKASFNSISSSQSNYKEVIIIFYGKVFQIVFLSFSSLDTFLIFSRLLQI